MYMVVIHGGTRHVGIRDNKFTIDEASRGFYDEVNELEKLILPLADGGDLVMGKEEIKNSVFLFYDDKDKDAHLLKR